jgi:hypothetical protein
MYDLRNNMRKASERNDFDGESYSEEEDDEIDNENQQHIHVISTPTARSAIINSIISTATRKTMTTTIFSEINNQHTKIIESKTSNDKSMTISSSSSSSRFVPMFLCFLFSFSSLYRYIHVNYFLF